MKSLLSLLILFTALNASGQVGMSDIIQAFRSGNAAKVVPFLDDSIEITSDKNNKVYNKSEAKDFLASFFSDNNVRDFKVLHQSESGNTSYVIGSLISPNGNFRLTLFTKDKSGRQLLQEIRIDK